MLNKHLEEENQGLTPEEIIAQMQETKNNKATQLAREQEVLSEVERRLRLANYYRALLDNDLFDSDPDELADIVQNEVREFVLDRLCYLLGTKAEKEKVRESDFSKDEIKHLKQLAAKLGAKPEILKMVDEKPTPKPPTKIPSIKPTRLAKKDPEPVKEVSPDPLPPVEEKPKNKGGRPKKVKPTEPAADKEGFFEKDGKRYYRKKFTLPNGQEKFVDMDANKVTNTEAKPMPSPEAALQLSMAQSAIMAPQLPAAVKVAKSLILNNGENNE